jgi:hypothetical protein
MLYDLLICFTLGNTNEVADCCSRLFSLHDDAFLEYMQTTFLVQPCWKLVTPPPDLTSLLSSTLLKQL